MGFYSNLNKKQKEYYDNYKHNHDCFCYILNDALRTKQSPIDFQEAIYFLDGIINKFQLEPGRVLYRATSSNLITPFISENIYINPEYLSTGSDKECIQRHFTNPHSPAYLKLDFPKGTFAAPMEDNPTGDGTEKEFLLPRHLKFEIIEHQDIIDKPTIDHIMGRFYARGVDSLKYYHLRHF